MGDGGITIFSSARQDEVRAVRYADISKIVHTFTIIFLKGKNPICTFKEDDGNRYKKALSVDSWLKNQEPDGEECEGHHTT
ncbi:hypothetical protein DSJ_24260 (plasmid) [Pantoea stewartii subsp. stewartii DC283]|uniref:Uncharacterized protein n=1 Tax=Pantoea stewartii subsp. stewartii DC283 TaxID=660596 RepID=A0ABM6KCN9_PANSE|nr:hypothetical protein DSJ_24260 [Pantoea stewartii subsp. stewartii DC283]